MTETVDGVVSAGNAARALNEVIDSLGSDLMYQLSTAGQELFHSNMLYWLATQAPEESKAIWALFGLEEPTAAVREYQKVDLWVCQLNGVSLLV